MKTLFYPFPPLITGFILGIILTLVGITAFGYHVFASIVSGAWSDKTGIVRVIGDQVRYGVSNENATSAYGKLQSIGNGTITIDTNSVMGQRVYTFSYDASTAFVGLNNDDESTEFPISPEDLVIGEGITVIADEPIGGNSPAHAVKVMNI